MTYNMVNPAGECIEASNEEMQRELDIIVKIREALEERLDEITKDVNCNRKHHLIENVLFNMRLEQLKCLVAIDSEYAEGIVEETQEIEKERLQFFKESLEEKDDEQN